jgi:hypothetical protein
MSNKELKELKTIGDEEVRSKEVRGEWMFKKS